MRDKVYNGVVYFEADSRIQQALLEFDGQTYPMQRVSDGANERFLVEIVGIHGGKRYTVQVTATGKNGESVLATQQTPYIREFENIVEADGTTNGISVVGSYYNWYVPGYHIPTDLPDAPRLGLYRSDNEEVFNRHVDWATGHGVGVLAFPYPYPPSTGAFDWLEPVFQRNIKAQLFNQQKFTFLSTFVDPGCHVRRNTSPCPPYNFDDPAIKDAFIASTNGLYAKYAGYSNYWKLGGRPAVMSWGTHAYLSEHGNVLDALRETRNSLGIFLIGEIASNLIVEESHYPMLSGGVDALYNYQPVLAPFHPWEMERWPKQVMLAEILESVVGLQRKWKELADSLGMNFVPVVSPGNDKSKDYRTPNDPHPIVLRTPDAFDKFISEALKLVDRERPILAVTSFNEWFEGTQIEPTEGYGLTYLQILKEQLTK